MGMKSDAAGTETNWGYNWCSLALTCHSSVCSSVCLWHWLVRIT